MFAQVVERDLDAVDAPARGEDARLRLDARRDEHAPRRREPGVEIEPLLVAHELLDARDLPDPLDLDRDRPPLTVPAQQVDGPDVRRVLAAHQGEVLAQGLYARGDQLLELGLDAVLL